MSLRTLALVCGVYDLLLGLPMLLAAPLVARLFGAPEPVPVVNAWLNGVLPSPEATSGPRATSPRWRGYFWTAGVFAKGLGAVVFVLDHFLNGSPPAFLLFAGTDGLLAVLTLWLLVSTPSPRPGGSAPPP
jgi:hypothetical protein